MSKIAILVDSGCDVPEGLGIYILPLLINYKDKTYRDRIDISPMEVYEKLDQEIPKTSLPTGDDIKNIFDKIKKDGYEEVLAITISSELSGTHNMIKIIGEDEKIKLKVIDSKNIAIGAGFIAMYAKSIVEKFDDLELLYNHVNEKIYNSTVFFCVDTLKYLQNGGRIGKVASIVGTKLNLKPIISCNKDGVYNTVCKVRGKKNAVLKMIENAKEFSKDAKEYNICISHGGAYQEIEEFSKIVKDNFKNASNIYNNEISPTLGVHTGPGLLGIGVQIIE